MAYVVPSDYNGAEKFLWPIDIIAIVRSQCKTLLFCAGFSLMQFDRNLDTHLGPIMFPADFSF